MTEEVFINISQETADAMIRAITEMNESLEEMSPAIDKLVARAEVRILGQCSEKIKKRMEKLNNAPRILRWYHLKKLRHEEEKTREVCEFISQRSKESKEKTSKRYRELAEHCRQVMLAVSGIDVSDNTRARAIVTARAMICHVLLQSGCTTIQAGELLGRKHSTICHYKDLMADFLSSPGYEAERELWNKFKAQI